MQFSNLGSSKLEIISKTHFFSIQTIQNYQISYVRHVLDPLYVFFPYLGAFFFVGGARGMGHNLQFVQLCSSKMEISGTDSFLNSNHPQ